MHDEGHHARGADLATAIDDKTHRSMDDVQCHLAQAQVFRELPRLQPEVLAG